MRQEDHALESGSDPFEDRTTFDIPFDGKSEVGRRTTMAVVAGTTGIVIFGRLLGVLRDILTARTFGTGDSVAAFATVIAMQGVTSTVMAEALSVVIARDSVLGDRTDPRRAVDSSIVFAIALTIIQVVLATPLAYWFSGGSATLEHETRVALLLTAPSTGATVVVGALVGWSNGRERFRLGASLTLAVTVIAVVGIAVSSVPWVAIYASWSIASCAVAGVAHAKILGRPRLSPHVIHVLAGATPTALTTLLFQSSFVIERFFGAKLGHGASASLNYAFKVSAAPVSIVVSSVSYVLLNRLAEVAADRREFLQRLRSVALISAAIGLAVAVLVMLFAEPFITLLYRRGRFDQNDVRNVTTAVRGYVFGIPAILLVFVGLRALQSQRRDRLMTLSAFVGAVATLCFTGFLWSRGVAWIAFGTAFGNWCFAILLLVFAFGRRAVDDPSTESPLGEGP